MCERREMAALEKRGLGIVVPTLDDVLSGRAASRQNILSIAGQTLLILLPNVCRLCCLDNTFIFKYFVGSSWII